MSIWVRGGIGILVLCLIWQCVTVIFEVPDYILPTPLQVLEAARIHHLLILKESLPTIIETVIGLFIGVLIGGLAALSMVFVRGIALWFLPLLIMSQAIPTFAMAPLLVIWFGFGMTSKIMTTVIMVFFPIASAFYDGLRKTPQAWLDLATTMQGKKWRVFWYIRIPAALPHFAAGLRVATAVAPIGAVVGEWVGSSQGLGFLMLSANARMQIDVMFAALITLMIFGLVLFYAVDRLLNRFITW